MLKDIIILVRILAKKKKKKSVYAVAVRYTYVHDAHRGLLTFFRSHGASVPSCAELT